jgi:hypothetical protein
MTCVARALPQGVCDLIGNAYEISTEFRDSHTRSVVLLGGSNYRPAGSNWYFPQTWQISQHEKYMLYSDGCVTTRALSCVGHTSFCVFSKVVRVQSITMYWPSSPAGTNGRLQSGFDASQTPPTPPTLRRRWALQSGQIQHKSARI